MGKSGAARSGADGAMLEQAMSQLARLAALAPNWDSYGAVPPTGAAIAEAEAVLRLAFHSFGDRARPYAIAPLADGGVSLEWKGARADVEVEAAADGALGYLFTGHSPLDDRQIERDRVSEREILDVLRLADLAQA